ncbi:glycosyltransferase family 4 protein [candidate division WOR-3 bacterium]|nr:glycosyltransferase family 4 protein [candidate division WOR-3 bacterium]
MRILYIVTAFPRYESDVITPWLTETIKRIKSRGVEIDVFAPSYKGLANQRVYGIDVKRFRYFFSRWEDLTHDETTPDRLKRGLRFKMLVPFYLMGGVIEIIKLCKKEKYDIIHVHWVFPHMLFGWIGRKICGAKVVSSFYGVELKWVKKKMPFLKPFLKWSVKSSDSVTALSSYTIKEINKIAKREVWYIPFGPAAKEWKDKTDRKLVSLQKNILFVGRLVERKGIKYLIEAFNIICRHEFNSCTLTIIGEGPEKKDLEKLAESRRLKDKVTFTGWVSENELRNYYQKCSLFVLPACIDSKGDTEGQGVVLVEAMSYKKPVIASNVGGIVDIVKDGETGLLVPEKDPEKLAKAIMRILDDREFAFKLGEEGYRFVKLRFGWDEIINKLLSVYSKVLEE